MTVKMLVKEKKEVLCELVSTFCEAHLDQEYKNLCLKVIEKLARKRQVPFLTGKLENWAGGIIHAIGLSNFLFDKSFEPYVSRSKLYSFFSVSESTISQKSKKIRDLLKMNLCNPDYATQHWLETNPVFNLVEIDGFILPANLIDN